MEQVKLASYEKLEEENRELKTVLRKLSHEMGNALTLLGASIFYVETDIATANGKCDVSDLKNDYKKAEGSVKTIFEIQDGKLVVVDVIVEK